MRYGIPVNHNGTISLEQVIDIQNPLPPWAQDADTFCAKMFPGFQGFVRVADDNVSGAVLQQDGSYLNPSAPAKVLSDSVLSWASLTAYLVTLLGDGTAGRTALGAIIKSCQASASGADNFFAAYLQGQGPFTKAEFTGVLADVSTAIVSNPSKTAVANNWPKA